MYWTLKTLNYNYNIIANLHTQQITVAHARCQSVMSSLAVARSRLLVMEVLLLLCSHPYWMTVGSQFPMVATDS
jgi:hypothetical protein